MPDANLEQAIREKLETPDERPTHLGDMARLHQLHLIELDIRTLKRLEYAVNAVSNLLIASVEGIPES